MVKFAAATVLNLVQDFIVFFKEKQCKISSLCSSRKQFSNFSSALYATGVKFHLTKRSHGNHMKSKLFYSGKHHLYGYKIEVCVSPLGFAVYARKRCSRSVSDVTIFRKEIKNQLMLIAKRTMRKISLT